GRGRDAVEEVFRRARHLRKREPSTRVERYDVGKSPADVDADLHDLPPGGAHVTIPAMRDLLERIDGWRDEQIELLAPLVNHASGTDDVMDVNRVGAILAERLERLGFTLRRVASERFGDHLVGDKPGAGPKRFLFVGHYDTVFPSGTAKQRPFRIDA